PSEALVDPAQNAALASGAHGDPFAYLGRHKVAEDGWIVRAFRPGAERAELLLEESASLPMTSAGDDLFVATLDRDSGAYRLRFGAAGATWEEHDPYRFGPVLGALDEHFIGEGSHLNLWQVLGAHPMTHEGVTGVHFAVWAPSAQRVSVVGDFNHWDGRRHPMRARGATGVWEIFLPEVTAGYRYKYEIRGADGLVQ